MRERVVSSLVTRLTLAVLAVLVLSLGLTTAVFVVQSRANDQTVALGELKAAIQPVQARTITSLLNANAQAPLARLRLPNGVNRVLLVSWPAGSPPHSDIVADSDNDGRAPASPIPLSTFPQLEAGPDIGVGQDAATIGGVDYAYIVEPVNRVTLNADVGSPIDAYRYVIALHRLRPLSDLTWNIVRQLAIAGGLAILVSLLAALLVLSRITRPLHAMTRAAENMARGDYDQQVDGAGASDEIGQLARSFNRMASEVKDAREAQRRFVANVSHDLRSPLTSIIGFSQALTDNDDMPPGQRRAAEIIHAEAERLQRLTVDLLDLSRLEAGRLPLSRRPLDLNPLLHDLAARYHAFPARRGVRFVEDLGAGPLPVLGDPDRLAQVVTNLLDNGLKFCDTGGEVRLSSCREGQAVTVRVTNTGSIPSEMLPHVFDRFYRGDHSRAERTGGSGVGLAIVRELVLAHGGSVVAESAPGAGVTMTVRLPLIDAATLPASAASDAGQFTKVLHNDNTLVIELPARSAYSSG